MYCLLTVVLCNIINDSFTFAEQKTFKLELVQALFRHGERTPERIEVYKNDPYDPEFYESVGYGKLTDIGMRRAYSIGQLLKKRYSAFLGEYNDDHVYAYSSGFDRTEASLQLVLSGLFQPSFHRNFTWSKTFNWTYISSRNDSHSVIDPFSSFIYCSKFRQLLKEALNSPEIKKRLEKYSELLKHVEDSTGLKKTNVFVTTFLIANNLLAVKSMGMKLPHWISEEQYKKLNEIVTILWDTIVLTPELRQITVGPLVKQFVKNMKNQEEGDKRKIFLYSGHDINIALFTRAHNFTMAPANPAYGSAVIIEKLRGRDDESYVRMFLWTGAGEELIKLKLKKCDCECPLKDYEKLMKPLFSDDDFDPCPKDASHDGIEFREIIRSNRIRML